MQLINLQARYEIALDQWNGGFRFKDGETTIDVSGRWHACNPIEDVIAAARCIAAGEVNEANPSPLGYQRTVRRPVEV